MNVQTTPLFLNGIRVIIDDYAVPATKPRNHLRERKWVHRCRYNKAKQYNVTTEMVPNNDMLSTGDALIMNSGTWERICAEMDKKK